MSRLLPRSGRVRSSLTSLTAVGAAVGSQHSRIQSWIDALSYNPFTPTLTDSPQTRPNNKGNEPRVSIVLTLTRPRQKTLKKRVDIAPLLVLFLASFFNCLSYRLIAAKWWRYLTVAPQSSTGSSEQAGSIDTRLIMLAALLRRISRLPSQSPIEAITFFFVLVTLVYFQLLQAVQDSEM